MLRIKEKKKKTAVVVVVVANAILQKQVNLQWFKFIKRLGGLN
jgi:hypothetical protein